MAAAASSGSSNGSNDPRSGVLPELAKETHVKVSVPNKLHRIKEVREEQGFSLKSIARRTGVDHRELEKQESSDFDLRVSDLHRWQQALEVPVADLLVDNPGSLSSPIHERAQLVKIMKTVVALSEVVHAPRATRMIQMLREQMIELMPELEEVVGWPSFGARRPTHQMGKIANDPIPLRALYLDGNDDQ